MRLNLDRGTWKRTALSDVVKNHNDYFDARRDGVLPYVAGPHIDPGSLSIDRYGSTLDDDFPPTFKRMFRSGDVLLHSRGVEKIGVVDRAGVTGEKLFVLRTVDPEVLDQRFLPWLISSPQSSRYFRENFSGSVNKFLNWRPLAAMEFDLPPVDEQQRIAELLWSIERHRGSLVTCIQRSQQSIRAGLSRMLKQTDRTETSRVAIGEVAQIRHGFAFSGQYFTADLSLPTVVTPGNFAIGGGFQAAAPKTYSGPVYPAFVLDPGDVIVTMTDLSKAGDTLGFSAEVPNDRTYLHNQRIGRVILRDPDRVDARFLMWILRTDEYRRHVLATSAGSTVRHTSPGRIESFQVALPPLAVQLEAVSLLSGAERDVQALEQEAATLVVLKSAILADLFGGSA